MSRPLSRLMWAGVFLIGTPLEAATQASPPPLGINLGDLRRYSLEQPLIDEMKRAEALTQTAGTWNTGELDKVQWDANGWPMSLKGSGHHFDRVSYILFGGDYAGWNSPLPRAGKFEVHYEGKGQLDYRFAARKTGSCGTNCDEINIDLSGNSLALVSIVGTDESDHLRNIQVIHSGGLCNGDPLKHHDSAATCDGNFESYAQLRNEMTFLPSFLDGIKPFSIVRFMDFQSTNTFPDVSSHSALLNLPLWNWDQRSKPTDAQWNNEDIGSAPAEVMIDMVNTTGAAPWFDMPTLASDDYVRGFAQTTLERLDSQQKVYVEYGNEIWNTAFPAGRWVEAKGREQWPSEGDAFKARLNWFAKRTAEICGIWKDTWGSEADRVECVMAGQAANSWVVDNYLLACPLWRDDPRNPNKGTDCGKQVDAIAIAPYFGGYVGDPGNQSKLEEMATGGEAGLKALFAELSAGGVLPVSHEGGALARSQQWVNATVAVAKKWNLPVLGYEGGQHLVGNNGVQGSQLVTDLFRKANRDSRMGDLYTQYLQQWQDSGAGSMVLYQNISPYARWGSWGLRESVSEQSPKYLAALQYAQASATPIDDAIVSLPAPVIPVPIAAITASAVAGVAPMTVDLDGSGSSAPQSTLKSWQWTTSDGQSASGQTAQFTFAEAGNPSVTLTVTNDEGKQAISRLTLAVTEATTHNDAGPTHAQNLSPVAAISAGKRMAGPKLTLSHWDHAFLKFDLGDIQQTPVSATLVLKHVDGYRGKTRVWPASGDLWNRPSEAPKAIGFNWLDSQSLDEQAPHSDTVRLDVSSLVFSELTGNRLLALELSNDSSSWRNYALADASLELTFAGQSADTSSGDTSSGDTSSGDTSSGDTSSGDTSSGDTSNGDTSNGDTSNGDTSNGDTGNEVTPPAPANIKPVAAFSWTTNDPSQPLALHLDASTSSDADGFIQSYTWLVEGQMFDGDQLDYRFASEGVYDVTLTVVDNSGELSATHRQVTVATTPDTDNRTAILLPVRDVGGGLRFDDRDLPFSRWDHGFIAFDLTALDGINVDSAALRLYVQQAISVVSSVYHDPEYQWTHPTVVPKRNALAQRGLLLDQQAHSTVGWLSFDIKEAVDAARSRGLKEVVLELTTDYDGWVRYGASEGLNSPRLEINGATLGDTPVAQPPVDSPSETTMTMDPPATNDPVVNMPMPGDTHMPGMMHNHWGNSPAYGPSLSSLPRGTGSDSYDVFNTGEMPGRAGDGVGAFRNVCNASHFSYDDPVVKPGQVNSTHLHMFFGNTLANGMSTYQSLRAAGGNTCRGGRSNRTAYWVPAVMDASGNVVVPDHINVYYKTGYRGVKASEVKTIPDGLRMVTGNAMSTTAQSADVVNFQCGTWSRNDHIPDCADKMVISLEFPQCWDGKNLDSPDHKSHMAYAKNGCPVSHPVALPVIAYQLHYSTGGSSAGWRLSSDMYDGDKMGYSAHADWFEAWDPDLKDSWTRNCLNKGNNCGSHMLGDGRIIR